ncbi:hypothetical protein V2J09_021293 [Rumex salicifolius]
MAAIEAQCFQVEAARQCMTSARKMFSAEAISFGKDLKAASFTKLTSASQLSAVRPFLRCFSSSTMKCKKVAVKAMAESTDKPVSGLSIDLRGKRAFIAGVADDNGYGWAIAKSLAAAGAEVLVGTWVPALNIFETSLRRGKFDESRVLPDGSLMEITKIYPLDAIYDSPEDVPEEVKANKRYAGSSKWTVKVI